MQGLIFQGVKPVVKPGCRTHKMTISLLESVSMNLNQSLTARFGHRGERADVCSLRTRWPRHCPHLWLSMGGHFQTHVTSEVRVRDAVCSCALASAFQRDFCGRRGRSASRLHTGALKCPQSVKSSQNLKQNPPFHMVNQKSEEPRLGV